ncbi:Signal transduction histidine kinase [Ekhidna lutea]|uniref:histidine kinase n=1 Tax=Ekhidna lutea TaxID=447679 RepID=A0A239KAR1_EKHLU|nr:tetratricopeptide repeat protein [Ekhidna lutea]SNT15487.1 Signal transduction histidine kinase [Ekhidna lutea]
MTKINHLFTLVALTTWISGFAQETTVDSLRAAIETAESDTAKISLYIDLAYESTDSAQLAAAQMAYELGKNVYDPNYIGRSKAVLGLLYSNIDLDSGMALMNDGINVYINNGLTEKASNGRWIQGLVYESYNAFDSAVAMHSRALEIAKTNEHFEEIANASSSLSGISNIRGENVDALQYALEALNAYKQAGMQKEMGQTHNLIGIIYDQKGLYSKALDHYLQARDIAIQTKDIDGEILINNNMGVIYDNMGDAEKSMQYYSDALEKARINNMPDNEATLLNNLSYIHLKSGDTTKAIEFLRRSLDIDLSEIYPCFESYPLEGMGSAYIGLGKLDSAEYFLNRALKTAKACEDVVVQAAVYRNLGVLYSRKKKMKEGIDALKQSLIISEKSNLKTDTKETLQEIYKHYKRQADNEKAMMYLEKYQQLTDSIYEAKNIEKATQLAAEYEFRKQVAEMDQERLEAEKKYTEELEAKSRENRLILLALVLFFLLAVTLGRSYFFIQKQNKKLKWLNDEKNKLMGIVAHDLRNPLNMIIGLMPLFEDAIKTNKDKNLKKYVELLGASSERMRTMIDRVLDISAIENMKVNLKLEKTDLSKLTFESIHNFDTIASQKEIKILDNIDKSIERFSNVDPNYLIQVIDNLLSNAIKFSDRGKQIEVALITNETYHKITVKDEGPGISEEEQKSLFQAYTTLSSKPTAQERSTGLGLSIAYKFIDAMGGKIECNSKPGEGTTFDIIFEKA